MPGISEQAFEVGKPNIVSEKALEEYSRLYKHVRFERQNNILQLTIHTDGGPIVWGGAPHEEMSRLWRDVGDDRENHVIILTGTGAWFTGPHGADAQRHFGGVPKPSEWDIGIRRGRSLQMDMLNVDVPIIAAVNGPVLRHLELALLCDIVLASDTATFEDSGHYVGGNLVPGDGAHVALSLLLGVNRARYMVFTGQSLSAAEAKTLGLVAEVMPADQVLPRAKELARQIAQRPKLVTRYTRQVMTQFIKYQMHQHLNTGLVLEALADVDRAMNAVPPPIQADK
jgi:enoyl-CoA hydratase/carnithine racemase